jgi:hypothetical protein
MSRVEDLHSNMAVRLLMTAVTYRIVIYIMELPAPDCACDPGRCKRSWRTIPLSPPPFLSRIPLVYDPALAAPLWGTPDLHLFYALK